METLALLYVNIIYSGRFFLLGNLNVFTVT
jgi:hypothetical protein